MPANLTAQYHKAEAEYRRAVTAEEQLQWLQEMLREMPKHKGTDKLQSDLKQKISKLKKEATAPGKSGRRGSGLRIPRQGAGTVVILGGVNAGKSQLLATYTRAKPEIAPYPFTTREPLPGMMPWQDTQVQLIDTPPITAGHIEPYLTSMIRAADLVLLCMDGSSDDAPDETAEVIAQLQARKTLLANETGFDEDDFSFLRVKTLLATTRGDDPGCSSRLEYFHEMITLALATHCVEFDSLESQEQLRKRIYEFLDVIRVYTKRRRKPADLADPFTIARGGTVEDLALKVHRELAESMKFAKVWGTIAHDGQIVGRDHPLCDQDVVELH